MDEIHPPVYNPLQRDQIRLVKFGYDGDRTSAILETFSLEGPIPSYHALSYTWLCDTSGVERNHVLHIEKQQLPVLDALQHFFHILGSKGALFDDTWWWIDSICIDLDNIEERGQQVQLMRRIYRKAHKVVFWLGESDDTDLAIDFIEELNSKIRQTTYNPDEIRSIFQQDHYSPHWVALTNFFQRRWWTRIWTLQEYAIPASVSFWYGTRCVSRLAVEGALMAGDQCTAIAFKQTPAFRHGFHRRRVQKLHDLRQKPGTKHSMSLISLAAYSSCFEATDDRDRLYGIRALATDAFLLDVDYWLSVEETYMRFAKSFIEHYKSLDVICFASICIAQPGSLLPSWVPDWRTTISDPQASPLMVSQTARTHIGNLRPPSAVFEPSDASPCYAASKDRPAVYKFEGPKLLAHGIVVDTIDGLVGSKNGELVQSSMFEETVFAEPTGSTSDILRSVCRSLVLDRKDRYMQFAMPTEEFFQDFMWLCTQLLKGPNFVVAKEFQEWFAWTKSLRIQGRSFEDILCDHKEADMNPPFQAPNQDEYVFDTFFGRFFDTVVRMSLRLMVTRKGHIGMAAPRAMKGDLVCVLFGCSVPVLLRPSQQGDTFIFIGECFLDGFMEGQGLEQRDSLERVFCIE
ncbi:heterokaryon incompatibility protein-domain-containing protein [Xylaria sp. FL0933]|nr:heterokaryon incompatibility protein-domain-containing protein [Xylaria sp. FL0933]